MKKGPPGTATVWAVETGQNLGMEIYDALKAAGWQMQESGVQMMFIAQPMQEDIDVFVHGEPGDTRQSSSSDPTTATLMHSLAALRRFKSGGLAYGQKTRRARCPTHEPHVKRRLMINQARWTLCLGQTARILIYM